MSDQASTPGLLTGIKRILAFYSEYPDLAFITTWELFPVARWE